MSEKKSGVGKRVLRSLFSASEENVKAWSVVCLMLGTIVLIQRASAEWPWYVDFLFFGIAAVFFYAGVSLLVKAVAARAAEKQPGAALPAPGTGAASSG